MQFRKPFKSKIVQFTVLTCFIFTVLFAISNVRVIIVNNNNEPVIYWTYSGVQYDTVESTVLEKGQKGTSSSDNNLTLSKTEVINGVKQNRKSHALENVCKYPILKPDDETIQDYVSHPRKVNCTKVQEDYVTFDPETSTLTVNQTLTSQNVKVTCSYRPIGGTQKPDIVVPKPLGDWSNLTIEKTIVLFDQFEVRCRRNDNKTSEVYRYAFAQIAPRPGVKYSKNTEKRLSVDILVLDSTSLNMFRRHMPSSFEYMKKDMGFYHLEGYTKVADNSMVNLLPVLAGIRYINGTYENHSLESELPEETLLNLDVLPFIWKDFAAKSCPTMFNDDVMDYTRGIFHYPWNWAKGFDAKPTDYFFRPWHVWHRRYGLNTSSQFCFANRPYHQLQLQLIERMITVYHQTCHFSFSFITDLPHDNPSNLERMDDDLKTMLENLHKSQRLNNTVLVIMGDHGHRIHPIQYSYIGRVEERMTFFGVYFPPWFRRLYPDVMIYLEMNKNRLTSNYDVNRMLKDIVDERFDPVPRPSAKGISLFSPIPIDRTCYQANIPDNHCPCMEFVREVNASDQLYKTCYQVLSNFTKEILGNFSSAECGGNFQKIDIHRMTVITTSQMIQHGVRQPTDDMLKRLERHLDGLVEYVEITYVLEPWSSEVEAKIRLQHNKKLKHVYVNSQVYLENFDQHCGAGNEQKSSCICLSAFIKL